jgi:transcription elongation factor/antiterminator RfaH
LSDYPLKDLRCDCKSPRFLRIFSIDGLAPPLLKDHQRFVIEFGFCGMTQRAWYVVYSKPQKEESAQFHLQLKGVQVFFPRLFLPRSLRVRKQLVPLFPNYLFVRVILPDQFNAVTWTPGVKRFVSFNDVPLPLEPEIVDYLAARATPDGIIMAQPNLTVGQEVRISGGPFDGLAGIIQQPPNSRGRVKILMRLLSRRMNVEVPIESLASPRVMYHPTVAKAVSHLQS